MSRCEIENSLATILPVDKSSTLKCFPIEFITMRWLRLGRGRSVLHILHLLPSRLRNVRHRGLREGDQLNHTPSSLALNLGVLMLCPLCLLISLLQDIHLPCCDLLGCSLLL